MPLTLDKLVKHQIDIERYKDNLADKYDEQFDILADNIFNKLASLPDNLSGLRTALVEVDSLIDKQIRQVELDFLGELKELLEMEIEWLIRHSDMELPEDEEEKSIFLAAILLGLLRGQTLRQAFNDIANNIKRGVRYTSLSGRSDSLSAIDIARSVRGTKTRRYRDGILNKYRHYLGGIVQTASQQYVNDTRIRGWNEVGWHDTKKWYRWIAILDSLTCVVCGGRSNKVYEYGKGPLPLAHSRCRCFIVPVSLVDTPPQSYSEWLRKQPREDVEDILGTGKAKLFLSGELALSRFATRQGRPLTLQELKKRM